MKSIETLEEENEFLKELLNEIDQLWCQDISDVMGDCNLNVADARISWPYLKRVHAYLEEIS